MANNVSKEKEAKAAKPAKPKKERRFHPIRYCKEMVAEVKRLTWPTKKETGAYTLVVIVFVIAVAIVLGVLDFLFTGGVGLLANIWP